VWRARAAGLRAVRARSYVEISGEGALSKKVIIAVIIAAIVVAGVVIGIQQATKSSSNSSTYAKNFTTDYPNVAQNLSGIPQNGQVLGSAKAPISIVEYMDYKCPICGAASHNLVPALVTDYVRTGKATMELRPVHVIQGNQSETAALAGLATAPQNRMWYFTELILRNQGNELDPWLTQTVLNDAATTSGVNIAQWNQVNAGQGVVTQFLNIANDFASDTSAAGDQQATPTFVVHGPKGTVVVQGDVPEAQITQAMQQVNGGKV
jgi:protein-disulfide isomerase